MGKLSTILILVFILALGAGVVAGVLVSRLPGLRGIISGQAQSNEPISTEGPRSPLTDELQLTARQQEQMRAIWESVRDDSHVCFDQSQMFQKERDDQIVALLNEDQKNSYAKIAQKYADKIARLNSDRDAAFQHAVERTNQILNPEQRVKYAEIIKNRLGRVPVLNSAHGGSASFRLSTMPVTQDAQ